MGYNSAVSNSISNNNIKLTADKIIEKLDQVREEGLKSKRRWIWELIQNAKDVPNDFDKVSIEIVLDKDELVFAHNGNSFTINNLTGLIQQVSSKHSTNEDKKVTGKFGSGFIATHLLSEIIRVEGVLEEINEIPQSFTFELDRSGQTSEELMPSIEKALNDLNDIEKSENFKPFIKYYSERTEDDFHTKFRYSLKEESFKTAEIGISDLLNSLPITLVFLDKIKQVRVIDKVRNTRQLFKIEEPANKHEEYLEVTVNIIDEIAHENISTKNFLLKTKGEIQLLVETENFTSYDLKSPSAKQPFLYRDFPLIGTENFYFPFILNGRELNPTERRDSIFLNGSTEKVKQNRAIIEDAINYSAEFVDHLIFKKTQKLYTVCLSSLPEYNFDDEDDSKTWYLERIQTKYRTQLIDKKLVGQGEETFKLSSIRFPSSFEKESPELRGLITEYLGEDRVPYSAEQEAWIKHLGPKEEMETWGMNLSYGIQELVIDIDKEESILNHEKIRDIFKWLNSFYKVLVQLGEDHLHSNYKLVINHRGKLCKLNSLFNEEVSETDANFLPDPFLDLLWELGVDWYDDLIHREIVNPNESHQKRNMSELNSSINEIFRKENFLETANCLDHILKAHSIVVPSSKEDSFQRQIFNTAKKIFKREDELIPNEFAAKYNYEIVHRLLIQAINNKIEKIENVKNLAIELDMTIEKTIIWLDQYLRLLDSKTADYSKFLKEGKIIPNRSENNVFCNYDDLLNYGTEYQTLDDDLLDVLFRLNKEKNYFNELVADGISINVSKTLNFERLGNEVINEVETIDRQGEHEEYRDALLQLINWTEKEKWLTQKYASKLLLLAGRIFYILTIEHSSNRENLMKILRNSAKINAIAKIIDNENLMDQIEKLSEMFPQGIPKTIMDYAKEDARKKKEFNNLLEVGSKVEHLFIKALEGFEISSEREKIIHAGGGAYDIRIYNPDTKKSFYIELKSCRYQNQDPINIAVSQAKRAVKELENKNFAIVIIERTMDNNMGEDYIKSNTKYFKNPGKHLSGIGNNFDTIKNSSNTDNVVDLKMEFAEFKGALDYKWVINEIGSLGFNDLLIDINTVLTSNNTN